MQGGKAGADDSQKRIRGSSVPDRCQDWARSIFAWRALFLFVAEELCMVRSIMMYSIAFNAVQVTAYYV